MMGTTYPDDPAFLPPDNGSGLFEPVKDLLKGDVVFGNLEGPLADGGETRKCRPGENCYAFRTPTAFGRTLAGAGFNVVSVANNHANDFGDAGRRATVATLDALGIAWSGLPGTVARVRAGGQDVALVAFTTYDHSNDMRDIPAAAELVRRLGEQHAVVIVSFHGGAEGLAALHVTGQDEYLGREPRGNVRAFAHAVIDAGADLVLGHGPHVLRAVELYRGRLIAYSLGNFCTYARFNLREAAGRAVILHATLDPDGRFVHGRAHPVVQLKPGGPRADPDGVGVRLLRDLTQADIAAPGLQIGYDGEIEPVQDAANAGPR
jgi:poly-gamma-glutamate capsule biosynthesis protein CapA/YwtB (metallophosphatase superfamily)